MAVSVSVKAVAPRVSAYASNDPRVSLGVAGIGVMTQTKAITPSDSVQTIEGDAGYLLKSVIIEPIPSNYGHIGYNGGILTVY